MNKSTETPKCLCGRETLLGIEWFITIDGIKCGDVMLQIGVVENVLDIVK